MDLLVHTTPSLEVIKSIITNGFYPSYAKEVFGGQDQKILMVSFSYLPFDEAVKDDTYGKYKVGVSLEWATSNNVHPVHYTFEGSNFESYLLNLLHLSISMKTLGPMVTMLRAGGFVQAQGSFLKEIKELAEDGITPGQATKLEVLNEHAVKASFTILFFAKNYVVKLQNGKRHIAFFDREWRYVPAMGLNGYGSLLLPKTVDGKDAKDYLHWESQPKPHGTSIPLKIGIEDIRLIVVKNKREAKEIKNFITNKVGAGRLDNLLSTNKLRIEFPKNCWF